MGLYEGFFQIISGLSLETLFWDANVLLFVDWNATTENLLMWVDQHKRAAHRFQSLYNPNEH